MNFKGKSKDKKLEARWQEGHFLGKYWRTGEALVSTEGVVRRAATTSCAGSHWM